MNMKKLLESMQEIDECGMDEAPMPAPSMAPPAMPQNDGEPVRMNVNLSASGAEHVADLMDMMKNAGVGDSKPVGKEQLPMRMDMERLKGIMDEPGDEDPNEELEPVDEIDTEEGYDNEPDERYGDMSDAIPDGNDLNRKKKAYPATQDGDNPMAVEDDSDDTSELEARIKEELKAALEGKYSKKKVDKKVSEKESPAGGPACWDGKKIGSPKTKMKGGKRVNNCVSA